MAQHELDETPAPAFQTQGISPKAIAAAVVGALLGIAVAALNAIQEQPSLLGPLPVWVQGVVLAVVPALVSFLSAYQAAPGVVTPAE